MKRRITMINLVTTMSRYLMILLILIYTYYNFRFFSLPDDESKLRLCRLQNVPLFLIFLLSGTIIYLQTEDEAVVLFFGAQLVFLSCTSSYTGCFTGMRRDCC